MGAWGAGSLDNDVALDALETFADDLDELEDALDLVPPVDADEACVALAAAEVVATALGRPPEDPPDRLLELAKDLGADEARDLRAEARAVTDLVLADDSELRELWDEDEESGAEWRAALEDLRARLRR